MLRSAALVALSVALLALPSCSKPPAPNIVLIVVDTLRADRLGAYGSVTGLTPYLDQLAARGTVFANTWAPSSWTCPSVASLFTSRYPSQHHVATYDSVLADEEVSLAEALEPRNYDAAGFSANFRLTRALGYAQGFQEWDADWKGGKIRGSYLRSQVGTWLRKKPHMPALLYLQYMEPHAPYEPPEPFRSKFQRNPQGALNSEVVNDKVLKWQRPTPQEVRFLSSLYSAEVASVDDELRKMMELLDKYGFLSNAIIVITADHGEELNEHKLMGHGRTLYNEAVRIPLIIVASGYAAGRVVQEDVSLMDVAPTLLELAGLPPEPRFEGRSLVPLLSGPSHGAKLAGLFSAESTPPAVSFELPSLGDRYDLRAHTDGIVRKSAKVLIKPGGEAVGYDLAADPRERTPDPASLNGTKTALLDELQRAKSERAKRANAEAQHKPLDDATKEKLRALGYSVH